QHRVTRELSSKVGGGLEDGVAFGAGQPPHEVLARAFRQTTWRQVRGRVDAEPAGGRYSPGGGVRLLEQTALFQHAEVVADGGARDVEVVGDVLGRHRVGRLDVRLSHHVQHAHVPF